MFLGCWVANFFMGVAPALFNNQMICRPKQMIKLISVGMKSICWFLINS